MFGATLYLPLPGLYIDSMTANPRVAVACGILDRSSSCCQHLVNGRIDSGTAASDGGVSCTLLLSCDKFGWRLLQGGGLQSLDEVTPCYTPKKKGGYHRGVVKVCSSVCLACLRMLQQQQC